MRGPSDAGTTGASRGRAGGRGPSRSRSPDSREEESTMMSQTIRRIAVATAVALIFVVGCGQGAPAVDTGDEEVTVKGTVKVKGKNATKGEVVFDPSNVERKTGPKTAPIEKDGTYSIKTLIGKNQVTVRSPEVNR